METSEPHSEETNPPSCAASQTLSLGDDFSDEKPGTLERIARVMQAFLFAGIKQHQTAIDVLWLIGSLLKTKDPADSTNRLFISKHVSDLRLICAVSFVVLFWITVGSAVIAVTDSRDLVVKPHPNDFRWLVDHATAFGTTFFKGFGPAVAAFGAILAWAYQKGSARLGVVDLFACEIDTLCRMITVNDGVNRQIRRYANGPSALGGGSDTVATPRFSSQENYFPVFEGDVKDLQTLEARVVVNITAFYTYMKAVRDSMRTLAAIKPSPNLFEDPSGTSTSDGTWHETVRNMIYMLYLGLESARKAIDDLVEFEPEQAERKIVILISELTAYGFLCTQFSDATDFRHLRLELRRPVYLEEVPALRQLVTNNIDGLRARGATLQNSELLRQWVAADRISPELNERLEGVRNRVCKGLQSVAR